MITHPFIFTPVAWKGEGVITFNMADDELPFSMHWQIASLLEGAIAFTQCIDVEGFPDQMINKFRIYSITSHSFSIELENHLVGKVKGNGIIDEKMIAWQFHKTNQSFEGFEIYELQANGSYKMHAEFTSGEGLRTLVHGFIERSNSP